MDHTLGQLRPGLDHSLHLLGKDPVAALSGPLGTVEGDVRILEKFNGTVSLAQGDTDAGLDLERSIATRQPEGLTQYIEQSLGNDLDTGIE
jgi:hypothetical protein